MTGRFFQIKGTMVGVKTKAEGMTEEDCKKERTLGRREGCGKEEYGKERGAWDGAGTVASAVVLRAGPILRAFELALLA